MDEVQMVPYEGKKQILAKPMTRGDYNTYRGWTIPLDEKPTDEGMLVEYVDGGNSNHPNHVNYISWSPLDVFDKAYKRNDTWENRVKNELAELSLKCIALDNALLRNEVPESSRYLLWRQLDFMRRYADVLGMRLEGKVTSPFSFGVAITALEEGKLVARTGWNGKGMFIMKQIPAEIGLDVIPKMQSVQQGAKDKLVKSGTTLKYMNQMLIIKADGTADSWAPSSSDVFAKDWFIV